MPWLFDMDETLVVAAGGTPMPSSFQMVLRITLALGIVSSLLISYWVYVVLCALRRAKRERKLVAHKTLREVFVFLIACLNVQTFGVVVLHSVRIAWEACAVYGATSALFYVLSRFFAYRVLILRASTMEIMMPPWYGQFLRVLKYISLSIFPGLVPIFIVASGQLVFQEGVCTLVIPGIAPLLAAITDSGFSGTLLMLFVVPLWKQSHLHDSEHVISETERSVLRRAARRNLVLSGIALVSSLLQLALSGFINLHLAQNEDLSVQHWRLFSSYGSSMDTLINAGTLVLLHRRLLFKRGGLHCTARAALVQPVTASARVDVLHAKSSETSQVS